MSLLPANAVVERIILSAIRRYEYEGTYDAASVVNGIPFSHKTLYIGAYQSYVWNSVAEERIKKYGATVAVGDLFQDIKRRDKEISGDGLVPPNTHKVQTVTEDLIVSSSVAINSIVLPLPGTSVSYPPSMKDAYQAILAADGLSLETLNTSVMNDLSRKGGYRHLICVPQNVKYNVEEDLNSLKIEFSLPSGLFL